MAPFKEIKKAMAPPTRLLRKLPLKTPTDLFLLFISNYRISSVSFDYDLIAPCCSFTAHNPSLTPEYLSWFPLFSCKGASWPTFGNPCVNLQASNIKVQAMLTFAEPLFLIITQSSVVSVFL